MSDLKSFLITTGRTLSQMALYAPEHPAVKGSVEESHRLLSDLLSDSPEYLISTHEGKFLVNGKTPEDVPESAFRPFLALLKTFNLHSISFTSGITPSEMITFFRLASSGELRRGQIDVQTFLAQNNVSSIKLNQARYAKIKEGEAVGAGNEGAGQGQGNGRDEFEGLSLDALLRKLVDKSVIDPKDRDHVFSRAISLVKNEIDSAVEKVVVEFNREKTRITNERERVESVVGTLADGVVVVDESGRVLMMNPSAEEIYGVKLGESLGKPLWEGLREEQMVALAKDLTTPTEHSVVKEVKIHGSQDATKTLRASSAAVQDINGRVVGMVSMLSDLTKQKELTRMQNEFMANVTHDLRAPVHALNLAVAAMLEGTAGPLNQEQNKMLALASRNVGRLARLIDDLLDFSKIESGKMSIHPQVIELEPLLKEAVASMESWSKGRGITLAYEHAESLIPVYADGDRLLQVVNNLISNAIKFTPSGGTVTVRAKKKADMSKPFVVVEVEDSGKGITKENQQRIFGRFVQLENKEKMDIRGTGLGLSICQALVQLHKGQLSVLSPPAGKAKGSLFAFTLPAVERSTIAPVKTPTEQKQTAPEAPAKMGFWQRIFRGFRIAILVVTALAMVSEARPFRAKVRRVISADVIQLENGDKVRYLGIDVPEKFAPVYAETVAASRNWVEDKEVMIRYGLTERDNEGRWLGYVYVDGEFVNEHLVREGLAFVSRLNNEKGYLPDLLAAEREARREKRGLWKDAAP